MIKVFFIYLAISKVNEISRAEIKFRVIRKVRDIRVGLTDTSKGLKNLSKLLNIEIDLNEVKLNRFTKI